MTEATAVADEARVLTIERLGGGGDGVAEVAGERWFIAGALPGERVQARATARTRDGVHAELVRIDAPAVDRIAPPCPHFRDARAPCGGCSLQHLASAPYAAFKRDLITTALRHRGLESVAPPVAEPVITPPHSRRRVGLSAVGTYEGAVLGFHQRRSRRVVDLQDCMIALPAISDALPALRTTLGAILRPGERAGVAVTALTSGVTVELTGPARFPGRRSRARLEELASELDWVHVAWRAHARQAFREIVARRPATHTFAGVEVALPYAAFLQATAEGEAAVADVACAALATDGGAAALADLYAGCGSLTFRLARDGHQVAAFEGERDAVRALRRAAHDAGLAVTAERRDLERQPLSPRELNRFDGVVFDPPRAGARATAAALARSTVPRVVAVSCHPGTFARDARTLVDSGYRIERIQPVDQFLYSSHVELVAVFQREGGS